MKKALFLIFLFVFSQPVLANEWPKVREFEMSVGFDYGAEQFHLNVPIYNEQGEPEYWFICTGGSDLYLDKHSSVNVNYVGPLSCVLNIENIEDGFSLLGSDSSAVWFTRGQFHSAGLVGACGDYPEYGKLRHFRLRGFELTLEVTDLNLKNERPSYFLLNINLKNDPTATSESAEPPGHLNPARQGGSCEKIEKGE